MIVVTDPAVIERFLDIELSLKRAYEEREKLLRVITHPAVAEIKVCSPNEDGTWNRLTIMDNASRIDSGFWEVVKVERYTTKLETLKNKPKELVEAEGK